MTVDLYRYHIAAVGWKEAGLLEDHILERNLLTLGTGTSGLHLISRKSHYFKFVSLEITMHLLPCNAMDTIKIGKRSRLLAFGALLLEFLVDFRTITVR